MHIMDRLYEEIENPLDNDEIVKKIIKASFAWVDVYSDLIKANSKSKRYVIVNDKEYKIKLLLLRFNMWKNNVLKADLSNVTEDSLFYGYNDIKHILSKIPDIKSYEDYMIYVPESIRKTFDKTTYDDMTWKHVYSSTLNIKEDDIGRTTQRLYINILKCDCEKFAYNFILECEKQNVPYYFKYMKIGRRDDGFVVYTNEKFIEEHINILTKVINKSDMPFYKPPILTGVINGFIGYGSQPQEDHMSFHQKRADILRKMKDVVIEYIVNNNEKVNIKLGSDDISFFNKAFRYYLFESLAGKKHLYSIIDDLCKDPKFLSYYLMVFDELLDENGIEQKVCFDTCRLGPYYSDQKPHIKTVPMY